MKINAPLDLALNELSNFIVHNGDTSNLNLTIKAGRLVYDTTNCCLFLGVDNNGTKKWTRLLDADNSIDFSAYAKKDQVINLVTNATSDDGFVYALTNNGTKTLATINIPYAYANIRAYVDRPMEVQAFPGLMNATDYESFVRMRIDYSSLSQMKTWGNHNDEGYAKMFRVEKMPETQIKSPDNAPSSVTFKHIYFDPSGDGKLYMSYMDLNNWNPDKPIQSVNGVDGKLLFESWEAASDGVNGMASIDYTKKGVCICVGGNIYKYNGLRWELIYEGATGDVESRLAAVEEKLNVDKGAVKEALDTWDEIINFLDGIDPTESGLAEWMETTTSNINGLNIWKNTVSSSIDDISKKINNPSTNGSAGDVLVKGAENNTTKWAKKKIVRYGVVNMTMSGADTINKDESWDISIADLETEDVTISLYKTDDDGNSYELVLADISVRKKTVNNPDGSSTEGWYVSVKFGNAAVRERYKVVITA